MDFSSILEESFNGIAAQFVSLAILIVASYIISFLFLSVLRAPNWLKNPISSVAALLAMYFGYFEIFLNSAV